MEGDSVASKTIREVKEEGGDLLNIIRGRTTTKAQGN